MRHLSPRATRGPIGVFRRSLRGLVLGGVLLQACHYDFALTDRPTRPVSKALLGAWFADEGRERLDVTAFGDDAYLAVENGRRYRVFHSDVSGVPLLSVQELDSAARRYVYFAWRLDPDGRRLRLRGVNTAVVPESTPTARAARRLLRAHRRNPDLFGDEVLYRREAVGPAPASPVEGAR